VMKECNLDGCFLYHEGYCSLNVRACKAKKDGDLITEEEYIEECER